jgi:hypothetical protein
MKDERGQGVGERRCWVEVGNNGRRENGRREDGRVEIDDFMNDDFL